jgi:hypothetical protein
MQAFGEQLWTIDGDRVRMLGIPFETRMTVIQLSDGGVWLHSPVAANEERFSAVEKLGPVAHIVAPNKFHHLFVRPWSERFPSARTWADAALRRRSAASFHEELGPTPPPEWRDDIDQVFFAGSKVLPETVFLHRRSRTLIVTDILQNHEPSADGWFWRGLKRLNGIVAPEGGAPRDWRLTVRDKATARAARDQILSWDFDSLVISHGRCLAHGARAFVERAFAWLD